MSEAVTETCLFVFLEDESFPLCVYGGQRQRTVAHLPMLVQQTKSHIHVHMHTKKNTICVRVCLNRTVTVSVFNLSVTLR